MAEKVTAGNMFDVLNRKPEKKKEAPQKPAPVPIIIAAKPNFAGGSTSWADDDEDDNFVIPQLIAKKPVDTREEDAEDDSDEDDSESDEEDEEDALEESQQHSNENGSIKTKDIEKSKKESQKQLSKKELKKKELEELEAILNDLGVSEETKQQSEANGEAPTRNSVADESEDDASVASEELAAAEFLEKTGVNLESSAAGKKKKAKKKAKKKPTQSAEGENIEPSSDRQVEPAESGGNDVDIKKVLQAKLKKKKKDKPTPSAVQAAALAEEAKARMQKKKKKKDKTNYNQMPTR